MHKSYLFFALGLTLLFLSCSRDDKMEYSDDFQIMPIDIQAAEFKLPDVIDELEIMRLEEGQEGLITEVRLLNKGVDKLIFTSPGERDVFIYSLLGELVTRFNHKGEGPEEYHDIQNLWIEGETIFIYSQANNRVLEYDLQGRFISSAKVEEACRDIFPLNNGYLAHYRDENQKLMLLFLDTNFKKQSTALPRKDVQGFMSLTWNTFNQYKGKVAYRTGLNDTIYLVSQDNEVKPIIHLDFGNNWLWSDPEVQANPEQAMNFVHEKKKVWAVESHLGERYLFLSYGLGFGDGAVTVLDRETGKQFRIDLIKKGGEEIGFHPVQWEGDRLLVSMPSYDVADLVAGLKSEQTKFREGTTLEEIESSENPVLMWVKFKGI